MLITRNFLETEKKIRQPIRADYGVGDATFTRTMGQLLGPPLLDGNRVEMPHNGDEIFPAMVVATDHTEDNRIVVTPAKNNDGALGPRSAWERRDGGFVPVNDFNFPEYDEGDRKPREAKVREEHIRQVFDSGRVWLDKAEAARTLQRLAGIGRTAAYDALKTHTGRFSGILTVREGGKIGLRAPRADEGSCHC